MNSDEIAIRVVEILNEHEIGYMLVGSLSTNFHSVIRATKDADIVIHSDLGKTARLIANEFDLLKLDPQIGFESVTATKKLILKAQIGEGFVIELFDLSDDEHDQERFQRRTQVDWEGRIAWVATAEDAIITKLRWASHLGRPKDIDDVSKVMAAQGDDLDYPYIESWCERHGTRTLLEKLRAEVAELDL